MVPSALETRIMMQSPSRIEVHDLCKYSSKSKNTLHIDPAIGNRVRLPSIQLRSLDTGELSPIVQVARKHTPIKIPKNNSKILKKQFDVTSGDTD